MMYLAAIERLMSFGRTFMMDPIDLKEIVILSTIGQFRVAVVESYAHLYVDCDVLSNEPDELYIVKTFGHAKAHTNFNDALELAKMIKIGLGTSMPIQSFVIDKKFSCITHAAFPEQVDSGSELDREIQADMYGTTPTSETSVFNPL